MGEKDLLHVKTGEQIENKRIVLLTLIFFIQENLSMLQAHIIYFDMYFFTFNTFNAMKRG